MVDTKQRILDTAERLFAEQGYDATSLRHIIAEAGVNLAAVHYHFGGKDEVLAQVVLRKVGPVNEARLARLDEAERDFGGKPPVEAILRAFLMPTAEAADKSPEFVKLMGRVVAEGLIENLALTHFQPMTDRFIGALARSLPELSRNELGWRIYFMFGAMSRALHGIPQTWLTGEAGDVRERLERLVVFLSGGFRAAASAPAAGETAAQTQTANHKVHR